MKKLKLGLILGLAVVLTAAFAVSGPAAAEKTNVTTVRNSRITLQIDRAEYVIMVSPYILIL